MKYVFLLIIIVLSQLAACSSGKQPTPISHENETMMLMKYIPVILIDRKEIAGCDFVFQSADNSFLEPVNLPDSIRKNGLKLWLLFHPAKRSDE